MSNQSFKVKSGLTLTPVDLATLTNPQAGDLACDSNDSNKIKRYDAASASWTEVGSGAAGDVDTLLVQDFDSASLSTFSAPNGAQVGLSLITTNQLDGRQSARLIHQPLVGAIQYFKETFSVSPKYRGVNMTASLLLRSSASQGNVTIQFRDETNSVDYPSQQLQTNSQVIASLVTNSTTLVSGFSNSNINSLKVGMSVTGSGIPTGTTIASINSSALTITLSQAATASATVSLRFSDLPRTIQLGFNIPANCSSYSYTISALQEAGSPETYVDDIVLKNYWIGMSNQGQSEILVPSIEQQNIIVVPSSNVTNSNILGSPLTSVGSGLFSYNSVTGVYTVLKQSNFNLHMSGRTTTAATSAFQIFVDEINVSQMDTVVGSGYEGNASYSAILNAGSTFRFYCGGSPSNSAETRSSVSATAITTSSVIVNDIVPSKAVLGNTAIDVPNVTGWQGYTPTFQGFGTPTNIEFEWRQVGENVEIRGKFTLGSTTAVEARVGLPAGLTSAGTSIIPSIQICGHAVFNVSSTTYFSTEALIEPSVSYLTFGQQTSTTAGLAKANGNMGSLGNILSFFASVPCAGLSATEEVVVSGTQSALVQESDSEVKVFGSSSYGSTYTRVLRFPTLQTNTGDAILYQDSATLGASFTALKDGFYSVTAYLGDQVSSDRSQIAVTKNGTQFTTDAAGLTQSEVLFKTFQDTGTQAEVSTGSWSGPLKAGDVIRVHSDGSVPETTYTGFSMSYAGSLKQLNVSSDQKITIPTSELRFEGASARGTTATAIVKFDTIAKLRGDAFTITNTPELGTVITMKKAGRLSVSASVYINNISGLVTLTKNQAILTAAPISSEVLSAGGSTPNVISPVSWSGDIAAGDIIRIFANFAPTANTTNNLNLSFQEQEIQVSVSNTLPQFSDSDSSIRVDTANGYGSTWIRTRRFSNITENLGSDIAYEDLPTEGAKFTVRTSGIYSISYTDSSLSTSDSIGITRNGTNTFVGSNSASAILALQQKSASDENNINCSWIGYLVAGDVIRPGTDNSGAASNNARVSFTISKVGKPNVTGVNVTPFVNVPQPESQYLQTDVTTLIGGGAVITVNYTINTNTGILSYNSSTGIFTALKKCSISASLTLTANAAAVVESYIVAAGRIVALDSSPAIATQRANASGVFQLSAGETFYFQNNGAGAASRVMANIVATALSDQILTAPETFSTDTASLQYAGSGSYTLSTLQNAPIGTYITFTYAANSNTRSQTTTRPNQTDADMNTNGILLYTRSYTQAGGSTAAQPAAMAIQIGRGLKGVSLDLYKSASKTTSGVTLPNNNGSGTKSLGFNLQSYDEKTGILYIDCAYQKNTTYTTATFDFIDQTEQTSGYLVINASKNPALTGFGLNRISSRAISTSGQAIGTTNTIQSFTEETFDTNGSWDGSTFTAPETGYYQVSAGLITATVLISASGGVVLDLYKNGVVYSTAKCLGTGASNSHGVQISDVLFLNKSDTVAIYARSTVATTQGTTSGNNFVSISKVSI